MVAKKEPSSVSLLVEEKVDMLATMKEEHLVEKTVAQMEYCLGENLVMPTANWMVEYWASH